MNKINSHYHQVKEFHEAFDLPVRNKPNKEMLKNDEKTKRYCIIVQTKNMDSY